MQRLFRLILQLIVLAIVVFLLTAAWIVFDGLNDSGDKTDVALVLGQSRQEQGKLDPQTAARLDRAIDLFNQGAFPYIIVSEASQSDGVLQDHAAAMAKYLEEHGVAAGAVIEAHDGTDTLETAHRTAAIMKGREFRSVTIVTDYYHVTRTKLFLMQDGIKHVEKAHVGKLRQEDAMEIGQEVVALYKYLGTTYLLPAAKTVEKEASVGFDKAKVEANDAKKTVDNKLNSLSR